MEHLPLKKNLTTNYVGSELSVQNSPQQRSRMNFPRKGSLWKSAAGPILLILICIGSFLLFGNQQSPSFKITQENTEKIESIPFKIMPHPFKPASTWGDIQKPYPTGAWWLNLAIDGGQVCAVPEPYGVRLSSAGLVVSNPMAYRVVSQKAIQNGCGQDIIIGSAEAYSSAIIQGFDEFSVSMKFGLEEEQGYFLSHLVSGSPAIATEYVGATPSIQAGPGLFSKVNGQTTVGGVFTGTSFSVELPTSATWSIFASEEITFTWDEQGILEATEPFNGFLQVAACTTPMTCEELAPFMSAFATGGRMVHEIDGDSAKIIYKWEKKGEGDLLMLAAPHHMDILHAPVVAVEGRFLSMKGPLVGVVGSEWIMNENLTSITWTSPNSVDPDSTWGQAIQEQLQIDADVMFRTMIAVDPYGFGKEIGKAARLALIAEEFGQPELARELASAVEEKIARWLKDSNQDYLVYDETWGGISSSYGMQDSAADFGNGWYNDHHFQYGYFAYAMAVVQHLDPTFHDRHGNQTDFLIGDIATMSSNSTLFPKVRHKDFWSFHSWADGLFPQGDGKNEESSTEAINAYYGVMLYGEATGNAELRDWGRLLLAMEIRATKKYWHMSDDSVYDSVFAVNRMVGNIGSLDARDATWFGDNHVYVHGINMIPFTPITEDVFSCEFVQMEYFALEPYISSAMPQWQGFSYLAHAIIDQEAAWEEFNLLTTFDDGLSKTNGLYWIASRPACEVPANLTEKPAVISPECSANSACFGMGMYEGDCCPTSTGAFLGCCPQGISYPSPSLPEGNCAQNDQCSLLGLKGDCCPTKEGVYLGCCSKISSVTLAPEMPPPPEGTCATDPGCAPLGLEGDCCPNSEGTYLECCSSSSSGAEASDAQGTCTTDPGCAALGLEGDCCPTAEGVYLGCCSSPSGSSTHKPATQGTCATDSGCANSGLVGECCPTDEGVYLGCCSSTSGSSTQKPATQGTCVTDPGCANSGLVGECCPTDEGVYLGCCSSTAGATTHKPVTQGTCSTDPGCSNSGLVGECCPSDEGVYLGCCSSNKQSASTGTCSTNPGCSSLGLEGDCCPGSNGIYLECCTTISPTLDKSTPTERPQL